MKSSRKNGVGKSLQTRPAWRHPIRLYLEALEERLPLGDMILGGLLTGVLPELGFRFMNERTNAHDAAGYPLEPQPLATLWRDQAVPQPSHARSDSAFALPADARWAYAAASSPQSASQQLEVWMASVGDPQVDPFSVDWFGEGDATRAGRGGRILGGADEGMVRPGSDGPAPAEAEGAREGSDGRTAERISSQHALPSAQGVVSGTGAALDLANLDVAAAGRSSPAAADLAPQNAVPAFGRAASAPAVAQAVTAPPLGPGDTSPWMPGSTPSYTCNSSPIGGMSVPTTNSTGVTTSFTLQNGRSYTLVAAGDFSVTSSPPVRGDSAFQDMIHPRTVAADGTTPVGLRVVGASATSTWGPYHPHHIYRMEVTGQGAPIRIYYTDAAAAYTHHAGNLSVQILQGPVSGLDIAPCLTGTMPDCPDCDTLPSTAEGADGGENPDAYTDEPFRRSDGTIFHRQRDLSGPVHLRVSDLPLKCGNPGPSGTCRDVYPRRRPQESVTSRLDQVRSYTNNASYSNSYSYNGPGMDILQQPFLVQSGSTTIIVISSGTSDRYFDYNGTAYVPRYWVKDKLVHNTGEFVLTDTTGQIFHFSDFTGSIPLAQQGQLNSMVDQAGNTLTVTRFPTGDPNAGKVGEQQWMIGAGGATDSFVYTYIPTGQTNAGLLQNVLRRRKPSSGGSFTTIRQVAYTYYDGSPTSFGNLGNLQTATTEDAAGNVLDVSYYRYYKDYSCNPNCIGYPNAMQYELTPASYARAQAALPNPLTASNAALAPFADHYFEYDNYERVTKEVAQAAGNSSPPTSGLGTFTYQYFVSDNTGPTDLFNNAAYKNVETLPDGSTATSYANYNGQVMLNVFQAGTQQWEVFYKYDNVGHIILTASPSALSGFDENVPDLLDQGSTSYGYLRDHAGRIELTDYFTGTTTAGEMTAGDVNGYLTDTKVEQGKADPAPALLSKIQYFAHTAGPANGGATVYPVAKNIVYRNGTSSCTDATNCEETDYTYSWLMLSLQPTTRIQSRTVQPPVVLLDSTGQNGPGTVDAYTTYYDNWGREIWSRDSINAPLGVADGYITYTEYDPQSGAVVKSIRDVDMTRTSDFANRPYLPTNPDGTVWTSPPGTRLHLITQYQVDGLGRVLRRTDPAGTVTIFDYKDTNHEVRTYPGWTGTAPTGPTQITRDDRSQSPSYVETSTAITPPQPDPVTGQPAGGETIQMADVQTLNRTYTSAGGQVVNADAYFSFTGMTNYPADTGTINTNFYRTSYTYDARGRRSQTTNPTNTITQTDYDALSRVIDTQVGTTSATPVMVSQYVYDQTTAGGPGGVGDSTLTQETQFPRDGSPNRVNQYFYDWRDRRVAGKWGVQASETDGTHRPIVYLDYDNLNEIVARERYDGDGVNITVTNGVPVRPALANRRARMALAYDNQQRMYQVNVFSINQGDGTLTTPSSLNTNVWYDHRGNLIKVSKPGGLVAKAQYDGAGRPTTLYSTDDIANPTWADAGIVTNNNVLSQLEASYDGNNNPTFVVDRERFHNETTLGDLGTPAMAPLARVSYVASYYDAANRLTTEVDAGTNAGTTYSRPSTPDPRTNPVLRTDYAYNPAGRLQDTTDARALVTRTLYDRLGRATSVIEAYTDGNPTNTNNRTTAFTYDGDNNLLTYTAVLPTTQQQTVYTYGVTTTNCGTTGSCLNSNDLLRTVTYPGQTPTESYTYNALADVASFTDRNNTLHNYSYDTLDRLTADAVTIPGGSQVDGTVTKLGYNYDTGGRPFQFTSYRPDGGVVNQVQRGYNGLGQLTNEYQSHSGAVVVGTTPQVQYAYSVMAGGNHSRLTSMTYPNTSPVRTLRYNYNATTLDDSVSRLTSITDGGTTLETYAYLGLDTVVKRGHPEPGIDLTYIAQTGDPSCVPACSGGDQYTGLDRFGRVVDQRWIPTSSPQSPTDRFLYIYDQDSNRLTRTNAVNTNFNETYSYDNFNQLTNFTRGSHSQSWSTLDPLGNWGNNFSDVTNSVTSTQNRGNNTQNQVTSLTGTNQYASWVAPTYDNNGNTVTDQFGKTLVYDAWNRLVQYKSGSTVLASYAYDALDRRIIENPGTARDLYYSAAWQVLEERSGGSLQYQYVWNPGSAEPDGLACNCEGSLQAQSTIGSGVDLLVERDDNSGNRLYTQQDANDNITALVGKDTNGNWVAQERYVYDPYGSPTALDPGTWAQRSSSFFSWSYLHQGGRYDSASTLYQFRHRDLAPSLGRWIQQDPIRYLAGDSNLYGYLQGMPVSSTDPYGLVDSISGAVRACMSLPTHAQRLQCLETLFKLYQETGQISQRGGKLLLDYLGKLRKVQDHINKIKRFKNELKGLKDSLRQASGKKKQDALKNAIEKMEEGIKGHIKEVKQMKCDKEAVGEQALREAGLIE